MFKSSSLLILLALISINYGFPCCIVHESESSCGAEAGTTCVWLEDDDPLYVSGASQGLQCVSHPWVKCEKDGICPPPPTNPVPSHCVFDTCTNNAISYNVAFLIDESGSVGRTNYLTSLDFVQNMVENDINQVSPISMLAFASGLDRIYRFSDSQDDQKAGALAALHAERSNYNSGGTCTATALREAVNEFTNTPGISASDNNILFLMTDGYPNCGGDVCAEKSSLDAAGIEVYVVGVSSGFSASRVSCLVDNQNTNILTIPKFSTELFYKLESQLRHVVCPVVFVNDNIFVSMGGVLYNYGYEYGQQMFWFIFVAFIICPLVYYKRDTICGKQGKYQPLREVESKYGSTV